jgi:hypothetical protein
LHIRKIAVDGFIQVFDKSNGFQVAVAAVFVGFPLAFGTGIIKAKNRRNRIYPNAVNMKIVKPKTGTADQKRFDLSPFVIENIEFQSG